MVLSLLFQLPQALVLLLSWLVLFFFPLCVGSCVVDPVDAGSGLTPCGAVAPSGAVQVAAPPVSADAASASLVPSDSVGFFAAIGFSSFASPSGSGCVKWLPPKLGFFKLNVDAAICSADECFGVGAVVRNGLGSLVAVKGFFFQRLVLVDVAEARAVLEGLWLAAEFNLFPLVVESDSLTVVNLYAGVLVSRSDIQVLLNKLKIISCSFVPRACNVVAYSVAKRTLCSRGSLFWVDSFPSWLSKLAMDDVACVVSV
ncbi:hypothetical protein ACOSQ4_011767 [Xanthoceras sorbifolium]